ncbi:hypothetical protein [Paraflavitalea speifideaquila]|uniref:hypothetical protein n=1 Tax=Paraflavitalea speifideaquila TaxID=3076558 RepID=UPI0028E9FBA6|nr:hypothetical protein [Paraflavitalea speifideiaquila]
MVRYLKTGGVFSPEPKTIELLAWLIDFKERPFILGKRYAAATTAGSTITLSLPVEDYPDAPLVEKQEPEPHEQGTVHGMSEQMQRRGTVLVQAESVVSILPPWRYWNALVVSILMLAGELQVSDLG